MSSSRLVSIRLGSSLAAVGLLLSFAQALAGRSEGLEACDARDWTAAARELVPEEASTTDIAVVRCLADMYVDGLGLTRDPERAFRMWKRLADLGDDEAADMLGYYYLDGIGTRRDPVKAEQYLIRSAENGNRTAMSDLSLYYSLGFLGCCPDEAKAMYWTRKLAELGYRPAQIDLAKAYARGEGVPKDDGEAVKWALRAAKQESLWACLFLGYATRDGRGTGRDLVEAYKWFSVVAADRRSADAAEAAHQRELIEPQLTAAELQAAQHLALEWRITMHAP